MSSSFSPTQYCNCQAQHCQYFLQIYLYKNPSYPNKYLSTDPKWWSWNFFYQWFHVKWRSDVVPSRVYELLFGEISFGSKPEGGWLFGLELGYVIKFIGWHSTYTQKYSFGWSNLSLPVLKDGTFLAGELLRAWCWIKRNLD